ncbi:MAG TPA: substrate-binding domain-containing protein [Thermoanaerobaculia bacterium]
MPTEGLRRCGALFAAGLLVGGLLAGCRGEAPPPPEEEPEERVLLVLSEREEEVVGELLAAWSATTGFPIEVRYGEPGKLAAAVLDGESPDGPAVFLSRDAAALGALAAAGRALPLPADLVAAVNPLFVDAERRWVGLTGRARVVVHDPQRVARAVLPADLGGFGDPAHRGRFGLAPGSRSFRVHLAAWRALHGGPALDRLLARWAENEPVLAADGIALVEAVVDGELDFALVDHTDLWRVRAERGGGAGEEASGEASGGEASGEPGGADAGIARAPGSAEGAGPGAAVPLPAADSSGYLDLAGAAVLVESPAALALLRHLLGPEAQSRLAAATSEYPLRRDLEPPLPLLPLADLDLAQVDYRAVAAALAETEEAIADSLAR